MKLFARHTYINQRYDMTILVLAENREEANIKLQKALEEYRDENMNPEYRETLVFSDYAQSEMWIIDENKWTIVSPEILDN